MVRQVLEQSRQQTRAAAAIQKDQQQDGCLWLVAHSPIGPEQRRKAVGQLPAPVERIPQPQQHAAPLLRGQAAKALRVCQGLRQRARAQGTPKGGDISLVATTDGK